MVNIKYYLNRKAKPKKSTGVDEVFYHFPLVARANIGRLKAGYNFKSIVGEDVYITEKAYELAFEGGRPKDSAVIEHLRINQQEKILAEIIAQNSDGLKFKLKDLMKRFKKESLYLSPELDQLLLNVLKEFSDMVFLTGDSFISSYDYDDGKGEVLDLFGFGFHKNFIKDSDWKHLGFYSTLGDLLDISLIFEASIAFNYYMNHKVKNCSDIDGTIYSIKNTKENDRIEKFISKIDIDKLDKFYRKPHKIIYPGAAFIFYNKLGYRVDPAKAIRYVDEIEMIIRDHFSTF